jgi:hypothetical protein
MLSMLISKSTIKAQKLKPGISVLQFTEFQNFANHRVYVIDDERPSKYDKYKN